ncbi:putative multiple-sugar transport system permease YteP [Clostridia bacterium]|nr:putative multiple-sugar transport system permease YteP [Clostridia bacterium]
MIATSKPTKRNYNYFRQYGILYAMLALPIVYFIVFKYVPMTYIQIAFKKFNLFKNVWSMEWAGNNGMQYFIQAFKDRDFWYALSNTLTLNLLDLVAGFPAPIILAILLNELAFKKFKKFTQTIVYIPHFLSWIIISGLALQLLAPTTGLLNLLIIKMGGKAIPFLNVPSNWVGSYIVLGIWQSVGWNTIIYLAAVTGINSELYESASVDGANRMHRIWHITLPGLRPTIVVLLILALGRIFGSEFDRPYALSNNLVSSASNVISTYVYTKGIRGSQFSLTTAVGLFQSVICVLFLIGANALAEKFGEKGVM